MTRHSSTISQPSDNRRQEVQSAVKNACDHMRADGVNPRDYVEQLAWMFFLKAFDEAETRREAESSFNDQTHQHRLAKSLRWSVWSKELLTKPDELLTFVDGKLWPKLRHRPHHQYRCGRGPDPRLRDHELRHQDGSRTDGDGIGVVLGR